MKAMVWWCFTAAVMMLLTSGLSMSNHEYASAVMTGLLSVFCMVLTGVGIVLYHLMETR